MNEIRKAMFKSQLPKLEVEIGVFKNKKSGELAFCVMSVKTGLATSFSHNYIYNATEWERIDSEKVEGTERIQEAFHQDLLEQMGKIGN